MKAAYLVATVLIMAGFVMLCQPFTQLLFGWGFPVLLSGVVLFMILDHIPHRAAQHQEEETHG